MTCIVGYVEDCKVYIVGDSAGVNDYFQKTIRRDPKVFKQGPFIMGFTTSFRMGQILMSSKFKITKQKKNQSDYDYMITDFIDDVRNCFKDGGYLKSVNDKEEGGTFLVGYKGVLYEIQSNFQVAIPNDNYSAVGCGDDLAKGALYSLQKLSSFTTKLRITTALDAASHFSAGVSSPYNFVSMSLEESKKEVGKLKKIKKIKNNNENLK